MCGSEPRWVCVYMPIWMPQISLALLESLECLEILWLKLVVFWDSTPYISFSVGVGDFSVWEFSGNPVYFCCYDYFAANDPTSIHVIVFNLEEPYEIQLNQVIFWLSFLKSLVQVEEPIGELSHQGEWASFLLCFCPCSGLAPRGGTGAGPAACDLPLWLPFFHFSTRRHPCWEASWALAGCWVL